MITDPHDTNAADKNTESTSSSLLLTLNNELQHNSSEVIELRLDQVIPDPDQPRQTFDEDSLLDLAQSIQENGLLQPIVVQPTGHTDQYRIVIGERRWRAHQFTDKTAIPALIRSPNDVDVLALQIIENNQREDVAPLEEAKALQKMVALAGSKKQVAEAIGRSPSWLSKRLSLLNAPDAVQNLATTSAVQDINTLNSLAKLHQEDEATADRLIAEAMEGNSEGGLRAKVEQARKELSLSSQIKEHDQTREHSQSQSPLPESHYPELVTDASTFGQNQSQSKANRSDSDPLVCLIKEFKHLPLAQLTGIELLSLPLAQLEKKFTQFLQLQNNLGSASLQPLWQQFVQEHRQH